MDIKGIIKDLKSGDIIYVERALKELRYNGSIKVIPNIAALLNTDIDYNLRKKLIDFLSNVKDKEAVPVIIQMLKEHEHHECISDLLSVCWQSSLDFSDYIVQFTQLFVSGNYQTALESFTVIEEVIYSAKKVKIQKCHALLNASIEDINTEKLPLARELVKIFATEIQVN